MAREKIEYRVGTQSGRWLGNRRSILWVDRFTGPINLAIWGQFLVSGVLSTLPLQVEIPGVENLSSAVFSLIVTSIVIFSIAFAILNRTKEPAA